MALIAIVALSVTLRSLVQFHFSLEHSEMDRVHSPLIFAANLEPGLEDSQYAEITSSVKLMDRVSDTRLDRAIPRWQGDSEQNAQWEDLWNTYLIPILYITIDLQSAQSPEASAIAVQIQQLEGVSGIDWNRDEYQFRLERIAILDRKQQYFSTLFFFFLTAVTVALLGSYPSRFKRQYAVRTGLGGAGSQVNPERIWLLAIACHVALSVALYFLFFSIGYWLYPFQPPDGHSPGYFSLLVEGGTIVGVLTATVCLIGWWFNAQELDAISIIRPPRSE